MAELTNSTRRLPQATYTPLDRPRDASSEPNAWQKKATLDVFGVTDGELDRAAKSAGEKGAPVVAALKKVIKTRHASAGDQATLLREVPAAGLADVLELVIDDRAKRMARWRTDTEAPAPVPAQPSPSVAQAAVMQAWRPVSVGGRTVHLLTTSAGLDESDATGGGHSMGVRRTIGVRATLPGVAAAPLLGGKTAKTTSGFVGLVGTREDVELLAILRVDPMKVRFRDLPSLADRYLGVLWQFLGPLRVGALVEPVGFLHLERLAFSPAGIERGELAYSLPLAPSEEVTVEHKEWSNTSEEFEKIVTDYLESFSEEGVAEKSELSEAAASQKQHSMGFNTGVTASGSYGGVTITASAGFNLAESATASEEYTRKTSIDVTRKASSRAKQEHKLSFRTATERGTEDARLQKVKNPFEDRATRVDYYQLIRKWRVDLYRYGLRLTYDLSIPRPGSEILARIREIAEINELLENGFEFDLDPAAITRENYLEKAAEYGASVEPIPDETRHVALAEAREWTQDQASQVRNGTLVIDVDRDYEVTEAVIDFSFWPWSSDWNRDHPEWYADVLADRPDGSMPHFIGKQGQFPIIYKVWNLQQFSIDVRVTGTLRQEVFEQWRHRVWLAFRDAGQRRYYEARQTLKDRLARLKEELGGDDALSLRKIEREEVMKGVLRWLLGPTFTFNPRDMPDDLYDEAGAVDGLLVWGRMLAHGDLIRFLHHAIEWENVLYFLYPYFWSPPSDWELRKYLRHPDPMHRVFLRSGSARVVLTIRPGFERAFVAFMETGSIDGLAAEHPYFRIVEEMEAYARTNYPGIPPANSEEADTNERGRLIGTWYEYTPTSAIDIAFDEPMPSA